VSAKKCNTGGQRNSNMAAEPEILISLELRQTSSQFQWQIWGCRPRQTRQARRLFPRVWTTAGNGDIAVFAPTLPFLVVRCFHYHFPTPPSFDDCIILFILFTIPYHVRLLHKFDKLQTYIIYTIILLYFRICKYFWFGWLYCHFRLSAVIEIIWAHCIRVSQGYFEGLPFEK